jgi:hypothetical protein
MKGKSEAMTKLKMLLQLLMISVWTTVEVWCGQTPVAQQLQIPKNLTQGQKVKLICSTEQGSQPLKFDWTLNGRSVKDHKDIRVLQAEDEASILMIASLQSNHSGLFKCVISNQFGTSETSLQLKVQGTSNYTYKMGSFLIYNCNRPL